jgi:uncharacterized protein with GYD domain
MPTFILLSTLTTHGVRTLRRNPSRLQVVNAEIERFGARVLDQWAVLGPYDFVTVIEAPSAADVAELSLELGARGSTRFQTLAAIPIDTFLERLSTGDDD